MFQNVSLVTKVIRFCWRWWYEPGEPAEMPLWPPSPPWARTQRALHPKVEILGKLELAQRAGLETLGELRRSQQREVVWFFTCRVLLSCYVLQYQGSTHFTEFWSRHRIIGEFLMTWPSGSRKTIPFFIQVDLGMLLAEPQHSSFSFCFRIRVRGKKDLKILFTPPQKSVFSNRCWW